MEQSNNKVIEKMDSIERKLDVIIMDQLVLLNNDLRCELVYKESEIRKLEDTICELKKEVHRLKESIYIISDDYPYDNFCA